MVQHKRDFDRNLIVAHNLRALRERAGIRLDTLALRLGYTLEELWNLETGVEVHTASTAFSILQELCPPHLAPDWKKIMEETDWRKIYEEGAFVDGTGI